MDEALLITTRYVSLSALVPLALFIYFYATEPAPHKWYRRKLTKLWRLTDIGRTLMYDRIAWATLLVFGVSSRFVGHYAAEPYIRNAIYIALVVLFWRLLFTLRRLQLNSNTTPKSRRDKTDKHQSLPEMD